MNDEQHARFEDLKYAYVLGALTESERREFEAYLAANPELQAEVDELSSVANLLALAPQEHEPPPELRRNLLNRIGDAADTPFAEGPTPRAPVRRLWALSGLAATAAVLAVVGLLVWNLSLREENEDLRGELQTPQIYELQGSGAAQNVRGEVIEVRDDRAILTAENLPPAPEGEVYKTWLMREGVPEPAGTPSNRAMTVPPPRPSKALSKVPIPWL